LHTPFIPQQRALRKRIPIMKKISGLHECDSGSARFSGVMSARRAAVGRSEVYQPDAGRAKKTREGKGRNSFPARAGR